MIPHLKFMRKFKSGTNLSRARLLLQDENLDPHHKHSKSLEQAEKSKIKCNCKNIHDVFIELSRCRVVHIICICLYRLEVLCFYNMHNYINH